MSLKFKSSFSFGIDEVNDYLDNLLSDLDDMNSDIQDGMNDLRDGMNDFRDEMQDFKNSMKGSNRNRNNKHKAMDTFLELASEAGLPVRDSYDGGDSVSVNPAVNRVQRDNISSNKYMKLPVGKFILIVGLLLFRLILFLSKDAIIISWSIKGYSLISNLILIGVGVTGFSSGFHLYQYFKKRLLLSAPKKQLSLSMKKNISKEELMIKLNELLDGWKDMDGEEGLSYPYIQTAKCQIEDLDKIHSTLSLLVDNNNESSLTEVFNVINATEEQIIKNVVSVINHIKVELSIDGYDDTNIKEYLNDNDIMIEECSKLLKASLLYMDGKSDNNGIQEYIESMVETLNKLKKES